MSDAHEADDENRAAPAKRRGKDDTGPPDAAEALRTKRRDGERDKDEAGAGAISPDDLSSENDDGAG